MIPMWLLFRNYLDSEGCDCCEDTDHNKHKHQMLNALSIPHRYESSAAGSYTSIANIRWPDGRVDSI